MKRSIIPAAIKRIACTVSFVICILSCAAQDVYPISWFTGMRDPSLQLMIHGKNVGKARSVVINWPGITVKKVQAVENPNYLFVDLVIGAAASAGSLSIRLQGPGLSSYIAWELKAKNPGDGTTRIQGVTQADFIYLLMPDRFANGDPSNDSYPEMRDTIADRRDPFSRHGGDLAGIAQHLDYIKSLGVTTIWPTPVTENDMPRTTESASRRSTYHGYAFTDQYHVDRRFGGNAAYKKLIDSAHAKGLKFMQDAVYNHVGTDHWFIRDLPMKDWVNQWPVYTNTSYRDQPEVDPYASNVDRELSVSGWFTPFMADLNQRNPYVSNFLIQYAIWQTEEFGIDGWRVDTYFYSDRDFLNRINSALLKEFPKLTVFGEASVQSVINSAYFTQNNLDVGFKHNLYGVLDFPMYYAFSDGVRQRFGWGEGVTRVYNTLAQDIAYKDPTHNCIFLDNHDMDRFYSVAGENYQKYKMGINWLLTLRGVPQLYYGTEILMKNFKDPTDAEVRRDFPGGFPGDTVNKFVRQGRTDAEQAALTYVSALANFRKTSAAITAGNLMQYVPVNGIYVYFRYTDKQTIMVISNTSADAVKPDWARFSERAAHFSKCRNVVTGEMADLNDLTVAAGESVVLEMMT